MTLTWSLLISAGVWAFGHLKWSYEGAFEQLFTEEVRFKCYIFQTLKMQSSVGRGGLGGGGGVCQGEF